MSERFNVSVKLPCGQTLYVNEARSEEKHIILGTENPDGSCAQEVVIDRKSIKAVIHFLQNLAVTA